MTEVLHPAAREAPPPPAEPPGPPARGRGGRRGLPWAAVALALAALGIGALLIEGAHDEPREVRGLGGANLPVNDSATNPADLTANNSPTIVRNPVDRGNLVVVNRIDSPVYSCAVHASFDGGGRYTQTPIPAPEGARGPCFAPDAAFGPDGTLFVSFVTLTGRANAPDKVWITRSRDGGKTLTQPVETPLGPRSFQVRLTADPRTPGRLFLTWLQASELALYAFADTGNPIRAIRSDDGGVNWTEPTRVSDGSRMRVVAPTPAAGRRPGELYVAYLDLGDDELDYAGGHGGRRGPSYGGRWQLVVARSTDNGASWRESVVDDAVVPIQRFIVFTPPAPSIAVDQSDGSVHVAFHDGRDGDADVRLWTLEPGAPRWSAPVRVNDTPRGDGTAQYLPAVGVAKDGRVDVVYYDRREDRTNVLNHTSFQTSFDGGRTFERRIRLTDRASSSRIGSGLERGLADLGSRQALIAGDQRAYAVWTDTRGGSLRTAKQDLARGMVAISDPPRLSSLLEALLRVGGVVLLVLAAVALVAAVRPRTTA